MREELSLKGMGFIGYVLYFYKEWQVSAVYKISIFIKSLFKSLET